MFKRQKNETESDSPEGVRRDEVSAGDRALIETVIRAIPPERRAEALTRVYLRALASTSNPGVVA